MTDRWACGVCNEAFAVVHHRDLHRARAHTSPLDAMEQAAYDEAVAVEEAWLAHLRRHVRGGLAALPLVVSYASIMIALAVSGSPVFMGLMLVPGVLVFVALTYYLAWSKEEPLSIKG